MYSHMNYVWNLSELKILVRQTHLRFWDSHVNQVQKFTKVKNTCSSNSREILIWTRFKLLQNWKTQVPKNHVKFSGIFSSQSCMEFIKNKKYLFPKLMRFSSKSGLKFYKSERTQVPTNQVRFSGVLLPELYMAFIKTKNTSS